MFKESDYEKIILSPPISGMNQNISESILPPQFCYYLQNILASPLGQGTVRYGTKLAFQDADNKYKLIRAFAFKNVNGKSQIIRYGQEYILIVGADEESIIAPNKIRVSGGNYVFVKDSYLFLQYNYNGIIPPASYYLIKNVVQIDANTVEIEIGENSLPTVAPGDTLSIVSLYFASGVVDVYDVATNSLVAGQKIQNLAVACIPRGDLIASKFFICNGIDKIMTWDGTNLEVYTEFVKEFANTFNRISNTSFSFISNGSFIQSKYFAGNLIQLKIDGVTGTYTVSTIQIAGNVISITTQENLPNFGGQARIELYYSDSPPPFSYLKAVNDRLFALGQGVAGIEYRDSFNALRFYASFTTSIDVNGFKFFSEQTKTVPSTDISGKHGGADNIEAIAYLSGNTLFIGRNMTQVWQGTDPTTSQLPVSMSHVTTLPAGIAHGDLLIQLPNDISFITQNGNVSFSTLNIAKQLAATSSNAVNPLIQQYLKDILGSNLNYRACRAFKYNAGAFAGFKIGLNDILVSKYETSLYAWSVFSGDFAKSCDFVNDVDSSLFLFINGKIFQYADGVNSEVIYGDNGGSTPIEFGISWPVNNQKRWCNKRYEIQLDYSSNVFTNKSNYINININGDLSKTFNITDSYKFEFRGDVLGTVKLSTDGIKGFSFDAPFSFPKERLHFVGLDFFLSIIGQTVDGPISFKKVRLFGISER
jgi:hypothetical protein